MNRFGPVNLYHLPFAFLVLALGFVVSIHAASPSAAMSYRISFDAGDPRNARVAVAFTPVDDILYMNPGATQFPRRWATFVRNLKVEDDTGKAVEVTELPDGQWKMVLTGRRRLRLSYEVRLEHDSHKWSGGIDGVAYAKDWGVFYSGRALLILNGERRRNIRVDFELPPKWKISVPWKKRKAGNASYEASNLPELVNSLIFAGLHEELLLKRAGFELVFVLGGKEVIAEKEEFRRLASGVLGYYVEVMGGLPNPAPDNRFKRAVVIINEHDSTDGEVIGNNISILVEKGGGKTAATFSRFIFAHEFFHLWNGKSFAPETDKTEWFKEGFTNYYTLKALRRVGFLDDAAFLDLLNSLFYARYSGDDGVGRIPMTAGDQKHDHWGLIYGGGLFVGIAQDLMIRDATKNGRSLDDLMRALFKTYGGTTKGYTLDELRRRLSDLNGADQSGFFRDYIIGQQRLPIVDIFAPAGLDCRTGDDGLRLSKVPNPTKLQKSILDGMMGGR